MAKPSFLLRRANDSSSLRGRRRVAETSALRASLGGLALLAVVATPTIAGAQQKTFHLDRLEIPGAPDDGIALFRPATQQRAGAYGQLAIGYSLQPLRTRHITEDQATRRRSDVGVVDHQLTLYGSAGLEIADRLIFGATFPVSVFQDGQNPDYGTTTLLGGTKTTTVDTNGAAAGDVRLDLRGVLWRADDRRTAFGAQLSLFAPTGNGSTSNFGGDGQATVLPMVTFEHTVKFITFVANTGIHFRPRSSINDPTKDAGLGIGNEWRWAVGAFIPFKDGKYRIGGTIFGQTGFESDTDAATPIIGSTYFTRQNSPIEGQLEGRMKFGPGDRFWAGAGAGTRIANGYGAPNLRVLLLAGMYVPILDSDAVSPDRKLQMRKKWRDEAGPDRDHDGIPDDIDACPDQPEDHNDPDPSDGCPAPPKDRDGDGIPDSLDKCPDVPEDKDGVDDDDGCPEGTVDGDKDGIADAEDACPKDPGPPNADKMKNGCPLVTIEDDKLRILEQINFKTGSAVILADSFPTLEAVARVLRDYPGIKRMSIEGHTDNRGGAVLNKNLSQSRANSVMKWLVDHKIEASRLEAHGYGLEKPIKDNETEAGRALNRRVEFKIVKEEKK